MFSREKKKTHSKYKYIVVGRDDLLISYCGSVGHYLREKVPKEKLICRVVLPHAK